MDSDPSLYDFRANEEKRTSEVEEDDGHRTSSANQNVDVVLETGVAHQDVPSNQTIETTTVDDADENEENEEIPDEPDSEPKKSTRKYSYRSSKVTTKSI